MARKVETVKGSKVEGMAASTFAFINRQRTKQLNVPLLRQITEAALTELLGVAKWNLTFYLVGAKRMAEINETHLDHEGPTDVIAFDYSERGARNGGWDGKKPKPEIRNPKSETLHGEIFICVDVAVTQAREFRTTWQSEVVRYVVHALLHLCGHDDLASAPRRKMKRIENRCVRKLSRRFRIFRLLKRAGGKSKFKVEN